MRGEVVEMNRGDSKSSLRERQITKTDTQTDRQTDQTDIISMIMMI